MAMSTNRSSPEHIVSCLTDLRRVFGVGQKTTSEHLTWQNGLYIEALSDLSPAMLSAACKQIIRDGDRFPRPKEIRDAATIIGEQIVARLFPKTWQAFLDYRVNAVTLSALDVQLIRELISDATGSRNDDTLHMTGNTGTLARLAEEFEGMLPLAWEGQERCPERDESFRKLAKLGILYIE